MALGFRSFGLLALGLLAVAALPGPAAAETPQGQPVRVRAEIVSLDGTMLQLKDRAGAPVTVRLAADYAVSSLSKADFDDIKPGTFIGTAAVPQKDGTLKAIEVLIFPAAMKGTGEGHRPWDLLPESTMTNATVDSMVGAITGRTFKVKYKDGEKTVVVPQDAPIVLLGPGDRSMIKPGNHVFMIATKQADGTLTAARVTVGKDGLVPPM